MISKEFLKRLSEVNASRCIRWHGPAGLVDWSPERWLVATMGELGELALTDDDRNAEAADVAIYAELFAQRIGIKLGELEPDVDMTMIATFDGEIKLCTGQLGEAANVLKKAFRIEMNMANISEKERQISTLEDAYKTIGQHLMNLIHILDEMTYSDLEEAIIRKFNATSEKYGFPERL